MQGYARQISVSKKCHSIYRQLYRDSNWLGTTYWEKIVSIGSRCHDAPDNDSVIPLALVAHTEVAKSKADGTVALGAISMQAYAANQTMGNMQDDTWYEVVHFNIECHCRYGQESSYTDYPALSPIMSSLVSPSSPAPSPAPTHQCRRAWAVGINDMAHCFETTTSSNNENVPFHEWGFYNGLLNLHGLKTLDMYAQPTNNNVECSYGPQKVGSVGFSYHGKLVTVEMQTIGDFYMMSSQVHVGLDILPTNPKDDTYITDPQRFELIHPNLGGVTKDTYYLHGCQEDNWVAAVALVCGTFAEY